MVGPANGGASNNRSMVSSAPLAPLATAQATNAGAKYLPELRESVMNFSPIYCASFSMLMYIAKAKVRYSRVIR
jgi:hypothetical protein